MHGYVIGRIGTCWFLWGYFPFGQGEDDMRNAGYSDVHWAQKIDGLPVSAARTK